MALFTPENAATYSARGNSARWSRWRAAREKAQSQPQTTPIPTQIAETPEPVPDDPFVREQLTRIRNRMDTLLTLMDGHDLTDKAWDSYTRAYDRLFKSWQVLTKTPLPGSLRPEPTRAKKSQAPRGPLD